MTVKFWKYSALDSLFFRDGKPYNAGEGGQGQVIASFPPYMTTLQGAVRTALASGQGWSPETPHKWPGELGTPGDLGQLVLRGPYILKGEEVLFPAPLLYLQKEEQEITCTRLVPGEPVECDLGLVRLPQPAEPLEGGKLPEGQWLTFSGLEKVMAGGIPGEGDSVKEDKLWTPESRTGIKLDTVTRTAEDSQLYSSVHVRPEKDVYLGVEVSGVPEEWHRQVPSVVRLGGEGRLARVEVYDTSPVLPSPPGLKPAGGKIYFTVILITPGYFENMNSVVREGPPEICGSCVSACTGKAQQAGGWDMVNHCPRPLEPLLPAGSAWFFKAGEEELEKVLSLHGQCLGSKTEYGFGQIVIGCWGDSK